jgi:hypothetical protein
MYNLLTTIYLYNIFNTTKVKISKGKYKKLLKIKI